MRCGPASSVGGGGNARVSGAGRGLRPAPPRPRGPRRRPPRPPRARLTRQRVHPQVLRPHEVHVGLGHQRHLVVGVGVEVDPGPARGVPRQLLATHGPRLSAGCQLQHVVARVCGQQGRPGQAEAAGRDLRSTELLWPHRVCGWCGGSGLLLPSLGP